MSARGGSALTAMSGMDGGGEPVFTVDASDIVSDTNQNLREVAYRTESFKSGKSPNVGTASDTSGGMQMLELNSSLNATTWNRSASTAGGFPAAARFRDKNSFFKTGFQEEASELPASSSCPTAGNPASFQHGNYPNLASSDLKFPVNVEQWRETGFGAYRCSPLDCLYPGNGFWRPAYGGYPVSGPSSGLSRGSSRDDLASMGSPIFEYEERFRVDRRKLELLMLGRFESVKEPALDFFQRIGEETSTTVIWPSSLKIGAKSKKDPHIRIGGAEDCVKRAKTLIMEYLDTRTTRVTMKMDVSYTDHSHVIGKGGNTIRRVMAETGCHIHFPDSNRSNPNEKSNQVSIAGEMEGVEDARARVRELSPLVFTFDLPIMPSIDTVSHDPNDPYLKAVQEQYNVQVMFRQKQKNFPTTVVVVKGCEWESGRVKEATMLLVDHLCAGYGSPPPSSSAAASGESRERNGVARSVPITMNMEISPIHHCVVLGKGNMSLRSIMQRTKTTILFPDAGDPNIPPIRKGSVTITGSIHNVYFARQQLLGSLPLVLMFEMPDNVEMLDDAGVQKLQEELDVCISIKPKQRQANKSVHIKAQERNASSIYKVRQILLGLEGDPIEANVPEPYKMMPGSSSQMNGDGFVACSGRDFAVNRRLPSARGFSGGFNPSLCPPQCLPSFGAFGPKFTTCPPNFLPPPAAAGGDPQRCPGGGSSSSDVASMFGQPPYARALRNPFPASAPDMSAMVGGFPEMNGQYANLGKPEVSAPTQPISAAATMQPHYKWAGGVMQPDYLAGHPFGNALPPNHPFLQEYAHLVLRSITRMQREERHGYGDPNNNYLNVARCKDAKKQVDGGSAEKLDPKETASPRNSSPIHELGNLTNQLEALDFSQTDVTRKSGESYVNVSGNRLRASSASRLGSSSLMDCDGSRSSVLNASQNELKLLGGSHADEGNAQASPPSSNDESAADWRAPGREKKTLEMVAKNQLVELDAKRLLAVKALQTKPHWAAGELGFSSSMPESVMQEQLVNDESFGGGGGGDRLPPSGFGAKKVIQDPRLKYHVMQRSLDNPVTRSVVNGSQSAAEGPAWFGNAFALDSMLNRKSLVSESAQLGDDLPSLFAKQGLAKYTDLFLRHEVDLQTFATLTEQDLREIGIQTFGARKKLLLLANKVKQYFP